MERRRSMETRLHRQRFNAWWVWSCVVAAATSELVLGTPSVSSALDNLMSSVWKLGINVTREMEQSRGRFLSLRSCVPRDLFQILDLSTVWEIVSLVAVFVLYFGSSLGFSLGGGFGGALGGDLGGSTLSSTSFPVFEG
ncbi:hypothetical protein Bca101_044092 [Brassica carinata]